jgi:nucleotide-binding universal stress UspA family protein
VAEEIVKYANNNKIDLIVMATHGYSKAKQWLFGSVTQKVLYGTKIPVLLIKAKSSDASAKFNRVLIPLDGSPFSESAFPHVVELTKNTNKEILLLHICEPPIVPSYGSRPINPTWEKYRDDMWGETEKLSTTYLKKTMAALKKRGIKKIKSRVIKAQSREVARTIMQISKEENIDLIIIATQGRTGASSWVYGSIANRIVEESSQPILLIRPETLIPSSPPQNLLDDIWQAYIAGKV